MAGREGSGRGVGGGLALLAARPAARVWLQRAGPGQDVTGPPARADTGQANGLGPLADRHPVPRVFRDTQEPPGVLDEDRLRSLLRAVNRGCQSCHRVGLFLVEASCCSTARCPLGRATVVLISGLPIAGMDGPNWVHSRVIPECTPTVGKNIPDEQEELASFFPGGPFRLLFGLLPGLLPKVVLSGE